MMSEFFRLAAAACWMLSLAAFTSASSILEVWVTTLLTIFVPATSRSIAFLRSSSGLDNHFMNSHAASLFFEYFEME